MNERGRGNRSGRSEARLPFIPDELPKTLRPYLKIGTCSWKYPSWKGLVYDRDKAYRPDDFLADYARVFDTVEVDQWFWSLFPRSVRLPEARTVKLYARSVPENFKFTVKAPNALTLTHFYSKQPAGSAAVAGKPNGHFLSVELLARFLETLEPLGKKLGPVMFQFEYLNRNKMPSLQAFVERFGDFAERAPKGFQYAIEIRNPNYLLPPFFAFLKERGLGFVYLDGYYMPPIGRVFEQSNPHTAAFQVVRLHGGDRAEIEKETGEVWDRVVAPKPEGLKATAAIVRRNARRKVLTYLNLNNHYEGSAPLSARRLLDSL